MDARDIARSMGLQVPMRGAGVTARFGQYVVREERGMTFRLIDQAEVINAQRNKYQPKMCFSAGRR